MKNFLIILLLLAYSSTISSQVFWEEDFANGIPSEWEIEEILNLGVTWTYCPDTTMYSVGIDNTCPHNFNTFLNGFQTHFKSDTPENGYATCVLEPFINSLLGTPFLVNLTTDAIDCSDQESVFVSFNSHLGLNFAEGDRDVMFRVSTDKMNWTSFFPHPLLFPFASTLPGIKRWSKNPERINFDITEIAAGEEEVFIQWRWQGRDEFQWSIDDVRLSNETSVPAVDISIRPIGPFQSLMINYKTPVAQIDTAFFITDVGNLGSTRQTNITVRAQVLDESNTVLYSESILFPQLEVGERIEEVLFPPYFHQAGIGAFRVTYEAFSVDLDARPDDNFIAYPFFITKSEYAKNESPDTTINLFPTEEVFQGGPLEPNWAIANHFYIPNGGNFFLDSVLIELPGRRETFFNGNEIVFNELDIELDIFLYEWDNTGDLNLATPDEYRLVGQTEFPITSVFGRDIKVRLEGSLNPDLNIPLKSNQDYFIAVEYRDALVNNLFAIKASTLLDYNATILINETVGRPRFAALSKIGPNNNTYRPDIFGGDVVPHISFTITEDIGTSSTDQVLVKDGLLISPNPVDNMARVKFNLDIQENDILELRDINGRLIKTIALFNGQRQLDLDCSTLTNANYLLTYRSEKVISNSKLIVLR